MLIRQLIELLKGYDRELYIHTLKGETVQGYFTQGEDGRENINFFTSQSGL